jgi:hypothetical protein
MIRKMSFITGLLVGSCLCAWFLGAALVYLFTGKVLSVQSRADGIKLKLQDLAFYKLVPKEEV